VSQGKAELRMNFLNPSLKKISCVDLNDLSVFHRKQLSLLRQREEDMRMTCIPFEAENIISHGEEKLE
jgi:hypothetical protein